jgi:hypothetical protein
VYGCARYVKLGVLTVADRLPSGGEHLLDRRLDESFVRGPVREPVDAGAQGLRGDDRVGRMAWRSVDANRLSAQRRCEQKESCDEPTGRVTEGVSACQHRLEEELQARLQNAGIVSGRNNSKAGRAEYTETRR